MLNKTKKPLATITAAITLLATANAGSAAPVVLYDGTQTPDQQQWIYNSTSPAAVVRQTLRGTILDTTADNGMYAGYFKVSPVRLDRNKGYTVKFKVRVTSQSSASNNRAGFSIIVNSDARIGTQPYGIELGFWKNSIWAQNVGFTRGEEKSIKTYALWRTYTLAVQGDQYQLFVNNSPKPILQGQLRQYTGFNPPAGVPDVYKIPNLIFLGDDTTSASARVMIGPVEVNAN
ncbi:MAG: hypothetical protein WBG73_04660 [Coleofasciculaceae cyanobacterium]